MPVNSGRILYRGKVERLRLRVESQPGGQTGLELRSKILKQDFLKYDVKVKVEVKRFRAETQSAQS